MTQPPLSHRSINLYNRLNRDLAAFNYVLRVAKPSGACHPFTLFTLNGLFLQANRLFRRHQDLPHFFHVSLDKPMSQADLAVIIARLTAACLAFEERYAHLTADGVARAAAAARLNHLKG